MFWFRGQDISVGKAWHQPSHCLVLETLDASRIVWFQNRVVQSQGKCCQSGVSSAQQFCWDTYEESVPWSTCSTWHTLFLPGPGSSYTPFLLFSQTSPPQWCWKVQFCGLRTTVTSSKDRPASSENLGPQTFRWELSHGFGPASV